MNKNVRKERRNEKHNDMTGPTEREGDATGKTIQGLER